MLSRNTIFILFVLLGTVDICDAATLHLKDGSLIVGSILELNDGEDLVVDTEHMDEVVIEWEAVDQITDTTPLDVELFDGRRFSGQVVREGDDVVIEVAGTALQQFSAEDIYQMREYTTSL